MNLAVNPNQDIVVDSFAGGGGTSTGIEQALGYPPHIALNHDDIALGMHAANHPDTIHITENVWKVDLDEYIRGKKVGLLWASPDCRHFSVARGGKPTSKSVRQLAWSIVKFCKQLGPRRMPDVILMENVKEFKDWEEYATWKRAFRRLGYNKFGYTILRACDFGAPTIRKRLFIQIRRDGNPIKWPEPTHGDPLSSPVIQKKLKPWKTAAEIIDWDEPCPSIFDTSAEIKEKFGRRANRPLKDNTMRRIAAGIKKYVLDAEEPFFITYGQHGGANRSFNDPVHTITASRKDQNAVVVPTLMQMGYGERGEERRILDLGKPLGTTTAGGNKFAIAAAHISRQFGQSVGHDVDEPLATITSGGGGKAAMVAAFMAQHNGGVVGRRVDSPLAGLTTRGTQTQLVTGHMLSLKGSNRSAYPITDPTQTVCAGGGHASLVSALLIKYYGASIGQHLTEPLHSVTTNDRFGLVKLTINGEDWVIVDIGMRMLTPRELFRAQGFPDDYIIDTTADGKKITKTDQIHKCGNAVPPPFSKAIVAAACPDLISTGAPNG